MILMRIALNLMKIFGHFSCLCSPCVSFSSLSNSIVGNDWRIHEGCCSSWVWICISRNLYSLPSRAAKAHVNTKKETANQSLCTQAGTVASSGWLRLPNDSSNKLYYGVDDRKAWESHFKEWRNYHIVFEEAGLLWFVFDSVSGICATLLVMNRISRRLSLLWHPFVFAASLIAWETSCRRLLTHFRTSWRVQKASSSSSSSAVVATLMSEQLVLHFYDESARHRRLPDPSPEFTAIRVLWLRL